MTVAATLADDGVPALSGLQFFVGSYTATGGGSATGISLVEAHRSDDSEPRPTGGLVARTVAVLDDPSFLTLDADQQYLYAVSEMTVGTVHAFRHEPARIGSGSLVHLWSAPSGGDSPCHVRVDPSGALVVANYSSGTVTAVDPGSAPTPAVVTDTLPEAGGRVGRVGRVGPGGPGAGGLAGTGGAAGTAGPVADRQESPHAHQTIGGADGSMLVSDLGSDTIHEYRVARSADGPVLERTGAHHLPPGIGPRHMAWWGEDLLVSGELDGRVHRLRRDEHGSLRVVESAATSATATATGGTPGATGTPGAGGTPGSRGSTGESFLSHIVVTAAGLVYVAVRGRDTIAVLDATGPLALVAEVDSGGAWPRHFAFADVADGQSVLLVANERAGAIAILPLGPDGVPGAPIAQVPVGTPTCVVPLR